jgi:hypothetical protein
MRRCRPVGYIFAALAGLSIAASYLFPWSLLNCRHEEIDINSGRLRQTRFLLFVKASDRTEETWLSRAARSAAKEPLWHRANTFSPGVGHSPHYIFHSAIAQARELEILDSLVPFEPAARERVANDILILWQRDGRDEGAAAYLLRLSDVVMELRRAGETRTELADLPRIRAAGR